MEPNAEITTTVAPEATQPLRRELRSWGRDLVIALSLAVVIIIFFYQPVKVEGTSMTPLISDQERIFINKFVYRFEPIERGDVVVFWYPLDRSKSFIKRVVGLAGRHGGDSRGQVYVNGKLLPEPYVPPESADFGSLSPDANSEGRIFRDGRSSRSVRMIHEFSGLCRENLFTARRCSRIGRWIISVRFAVFAEARK